MNWASSIMARTMTFQSVPGTMDRYRNNNAKKTFNLPVTKMKEHMVHTVNLYMKHKCNMGFIVY